LALAATAGRDDMAALLLERGADVNRRSSEGATALHAAAGQGHAATVRLLLNAGAEARAANDRGVTPLHVAAMRGHREAAAALLEAGADPNPRAECPTPLSWAANWGDTGLLRLLVHHGADV